MSDEEFYNGLLDNRLGAAMVTIMAVGMGDGKYSAGRTN